MDLCLGYGNWFNVRQRTGFSRMQRYTVFPETPKQIAKFLSFYLFESLSIHYRILILTEDTPYRGGTPSSLSISIRILSAGEKKNGQGVESLSSRSSPPTLAACYGFPFFPPPYFPLAFQLKYSFGQYGPLNHSSGTTFPGLAISDLARQISIISSL